MTRREIWLLSLCLALAMVWTFTFKLIQGRSERQEVLVCDIYKDNERISALVADERIVDLLARKYQLHCTSEDGTKGWFSNR